MYVVGTTRPRYIIGLYYMEHNRQAGGGMHERDKWLIFQIVHYHSAELIGSSELTGGVVFRSYINS